MKHLPYTTGVERSLRQAAQALGCGLLLLAAAASAQVSKEYQIKAAFLYNFAKFTEWPAERFAGPTNPIVIGVFGKNPFAGELENIVRNRRINGREITVRTVKNLEEARETHILFFDPAEDAQLGSVLEPLNHAGVLTVGESDRFSSLDGVIRFLREGDKVRFEINEDAAERNGVRLSAQLLKLATAVHRKK